MLIYVYLRQKEFEEGVVEDGFVEYGRGAWSWAMDSAFVQCQAGFSGEVRAEADKSALYPVR